MARVTVTINLKADSIDVDQLEEDLQNFLDVQTPDSIESLSFSRIDIDEHDA